MTTARIIRWGAFTLVLASAGFLGAAAPTAAGLRLLRHVTLPEHRSVPTDIRWASDTSVYVSWDRAGVDEVGLNGAKRRTLVPNLMTLGGMQHYSQLAASSGTLLAASFNWNLVWRPIPAGPPPEEVVFGRRRITITHDVDVAGERVLLLGIATLESTHLEDFAPKGEVAWLGTVADGLQYLKPVLHDVGGPGAPNFLNCQTEDLGAVRFLSGGSFIVAPGFQDGVHLYNADGKRVRTWSNEQVGIDTHRTCGGPNKHLAEQIGFKPAWSAFLRRHHILDDILPLPQGPGLLVRSWGADEKAHWMLKVLKPGGIESYAVPITGDRVADRLRGDYRQGKIVLLLSASAFSWSLDPLDYPAEMFLMELPNP